MVTAPTPPSTPLPMRHQFEVFFTDERPRLVQAVATAIGDPDRAADAVDEAMLRAWRHWYEVAELAAPGGWVFRVALNHARSRWRKLRREVTRLGDLTGRDHAAEPPAAASVDPQLEQALANLTNDHREILVLRLVLGHDTAATAQLLEIPHGTVKSRLARAIDKLEIELEAPV